MDSYILFRKREHSISLDQVNFHTSSVYPTVLFQRNSLGSPSFNARLESGFANLKKSYNQKGALHII